MIILNLGNFKNSNALIIPCFVFLLLLHYNYVMKSQELVEMPFSSKCGYKKAFLLSLTIQDSDNKVKIKLYIYVE